MFRSGVLLVCCLPIFAFPLISAAEIYRWVDENGKVYFSDTKPESREAQTVTVDTPVVGPPDEGELRRRELLKRADADFQYNQRRAAEDAARQAAIDDEQARHTNNRQAQCTDARIRLGVLAENMPIYWTTDGQMRPAWSNDVYQGERRYIADDDRPALTTSAQRDIETHCGDPANSAAQYQTYRYWEHQQWCQALKADIVNAQQKRTRTPRERVEAMQAEFKRDC